MPVLSLQFLFFGRALLFTQNTGWCPCCPYCHKWNGLSHDGEEEEPEEEVLTYVHTPAGRLIGLCCHVYDYTSVMESNDQANAWLDDEIDKALAKHQS